MPVAIPYIRFSTKEQLSGSSLDRQQKKVDEWLARNPGYERSTESYDDRGLSGTGAHIERGRLGALLEAIKKGMIEPGSVILIEAIDRLTRLEPLEAIEPLRTIIRAGITLIDLESDTRYDAESLKGDSLLMFLFKARGAYEYSIRLSGRIVDSYDARAKDASEGKPIKKRQGFWLDSNGVLIQEKADIVRDVFKRFLNGDSLRSIHREHALTFANVASLRKLLRNRAVIGDWQRKKKIKIDGKSKLEDGELLQKVFDHAVSDEDFYQAQDLLDKTSAPGFTNARKFSLAGLLYCSECNAKMLFVNAGPNTVTDRLKCPNRNSGVHSCSNGFTLPVPVARYYASRTTLPYLFKGFQDSRLPELARQRIKLQGQLETAEREVFATESLLLINQNDTGLRERYTQRVRQRDELREAIGKLEATPDSSIDPRIINDWISLITHDEASAPLVKEFMTYYFSHDFNSYNRLLQLGGYGVLVQPDGKLSLRDTSLLPQASEVALGTLHYLGYIRKTKSFKVLANGVEELLNPDNFPEAFNNTNSLI